MPSCITSIDINCPVTPPVAELSVLLPARVTLQTGCVNAFQVTVAPSVNVASGFTAALVNDEYAPSLKFTNSVPSNCFIIISFAAHGHAKTIYVK